MTNEDKMLVIRGKGNGCMPAIGEIKYYCPPKITAEQGFNDPNTELCIYRMAKHKVKSELEALVRELSSEIGEKTCWIFYMQILLIEGSLFSERIEELILDGRSALTALSVARKNLLDQLAQKKQNGFIGSVKNEIEDVFTAISEALINTAIPLSHSEYVLVYPAPLPLHIVRIRGELAGIVAPNDWATEDIKALIDAMKIPVLLTDREIPRSHYSKKAIIDSVGGYLYIDPDLAALQKFNVSIQNANAEEAQREKVAKMPAVMQNGVRISLIPELSENSQEENLNADGSAILKNFSALPTENETTDEDSLFYFYRQITESTLQKPFIVRSLRESPFVKISKMDAENTSTRTESPELYVIHDRTVPIQLRALLRTSVYGNIFFAVGFNGASSEIEELSLLICELREELKTEGREISSVSLGVIIEALPSALLCEDVSDKCSFFIIEVSSILSQLKKLSSSESNNCNEENELCLKALDKIVASICHSAAKKSKNVFFYFRDIPSNEELKTVLRQKSPSIIIPSKNMIDLKKMIIEN